MMDGRPVKILLVEDDDAHAEIVRRNLADLRIGNEIYHVNDGQQALDYLFHVGSFADTSTCPRPDLVLLDLRLPKVDGLEVLNTIKADAALATIPVVILTTSAAEIDVTQAYAGKANSYLVKPIDFHKFTQLIETFGFYWLMWNQFPAGGALAT